GDGRPLALPEVRGRAVGIERHGAARVVYAGYRDVAVRGLALVVAVERVRRQQQIVREPLAAAQDAEMHEVRGLVGEGVHGPAVLGEQARGRQAVAVGMFVGVAKAQRPSRLPGLVAEVGEELARVAGGRAAPAVFVEGIEGNVPVERATETAVLRVDGPAAEGA